MNVVDNPAALHLRVDHTIDGPQFKKNNIIMFSLFMKPSRHHSYLCVSLTFSDPQLKGQNKH